MSTEIRIAGIVDESIVDGPGIRLTVFVQGCTHNCEGCHNPESHSKDGGSLISVRKILGMIDKNPLLDGITLSGGEPFQQAKECAVLAKAAKEKGLNVITYSGYTFEKIVAEADANPGWRDLLENSDVLVDGPFVLSQRSLMLRFRGSENQRIVDVKNSLEEKKIVTIIF
ncbi:MAG: anaerobic ribonucleoside-triphosphate reductase activating protein [Bacillota bacterium]